MGKNDLNTAPPLEPIGNGIFRFTENWSYYFPWSPEYVIIPKGYVTNFASVPKGFRWLISPTDKTLRQASAVHDYLVGEFAHYRGLVRDNNGVAKFVEWRRAAAIMRNIMRVDGVRSLKRMVVYWAVRLYGKVRGLE